jgi:hypothetical protein
MTLFPILLMVEEDAVGKVLRTLHHLAGITDVKLNLDEVPKIRGRGPGTKTVKAAKPPGAAAPERRPYGRNGHEGPTAQDVLINEMLSGQKTSEHLRKVIEAHGFAGAGTHALLGVMIDKGIVLRIEKGIYDLSPVARAKLAEAAPAALPPPNVGEIEPATRPRKGAGVEFIAKIIQDNNNRGTRQQMMSDGENEQLSNGLLSGAINYLQRVKYIRAVEPGVYELTAKGKKRFAQGPQAQPAQEG